jgi:hypothetical protein
MSVIAISDRPTLLAAASGDFPSLTRLVDGVRPVQGRGTALWDSVLASASLVANALDAPWSSS